MTEKVNRMGTEIFISYSHEDASYLKSNSLLGHLKGLERDGAHFWSDQEIQVGEDWDARIRNAIERADISLVLASQMFLNSKYCQEEEMRAFLLRARDEGLIIFPIVLSACDWQQTDWLRQRQFLPRNGQNIEEHFYKPGKRKAIFQQITEALRKYVKSVERTKRNDTLPVVAMKALSGSINTVNRMYPQLQSFHNGSPEEYREYGIVYEGKGDHVVAKNRSGQTTLTPADIKKLSDRQLRHISIFQEELEESYDHWEKLYRRRRLESPDVRLQTDKEMRLVIVAMKEALDRVFAFLKAANLQIDDHYYLFNDVIEAETRKVYE